MLKEAGYSERYGLGLVTTSGSLGLLIVPSVPLILYGIGAQQLDVGEPFTIQQLFLAGLLPVVLMVSALSAWTMWRHGGEKTNAVPPARGLDKPARGQVGGGAPLCRAGRRLLGDFRDI
ncbi:MAG: hypothetical protein CM1200mP9_05400 [Gammaproteobacteria bacterium]|nr:MAG: hypothetical protein CM1200mP9_05400 [Gammaproteobacteria bacterium]